MALPPHGQVTTAANLHRIGVVSDSDPGAIGAWKIWTEVDGSDNWVATHQRDEDDGGWHTIASAGGAAPADHAASHENGGGDEISVAGLSGELADPQPTTLAKISDASAFGRSLADDADAAAARTTLGLGTAAVAALDTDVTLAANSDTRTPSQKAVKTYIDGIVTGGATDVMIFKGVIDCSANPNYPAADAGNVYKVSVAGKIGGGSGPNVEAGDTLYCITDSTASGNQATVGANWVIAQVNVDGAVTTAGGVTFAADISVPPDAYDATAWNGNNEVPTKNDIRDKIETLGSGSVGPLTADDPPASYNAADDFFNGAALDTAGTRRSGATAWAWVNQGSATATQQYNLLSLALPASVGADNIRGVEQVLPSAPWKFQCKVYKTLENSTSTTAGLFLRESGTGKIYQFGISYAGSPRIWVLRYTNPTTFASDPSKSATVADTNRWVYLEVEDDNTNLHFRWSMTRGSWSSLGTLGRTEFMSGAPDRIMLGANTTTNAFEGVFKFIQKVA